MLSDDNDTQSQIVFQIIADICDTYFFNIDNEQKGLFVSADAKFAVFFALLEKVCVARTISPPPNFKTDMLMKFNWLTKNKLMLDTDMLQASELHFSSMSALSRNYLWIDVRLMYSIDADNKFVCDTLEKSATLLNAVGLEWFASNTTITLAEEEFTYLLELYTALRNTGYVFSFCSIYCILLCLML